MTVTLDQLLYGIRKQETGGGENGYREVNSIGATGAYQVLASNIPSWTKEALGHSLTQQEFINSPADQDATARYIIGKDYDKYGAAGAASVWYSGQPDATKTYGNPPVATYVQQVLQKALGGSIGSSTGTSAPPPTTSSGGSGNPFIPSEITDFFSGFTSLITGTTDSATSVLSIFKAFFQPSTYIRIAAGWFGIFALIVAFIFLAKEAKNA